jgi:PPP family 3-phenylpropionic acid transporter
VKNDFSRLQAFLARRYVLPKAYYFLVFAAGASLVPFIALYYQHIGMTGSQIGLLTGMQPLIAWLGASLWAALADASHQHERLVRSAIVGALVLVLALSRATAFFWLLPLVVIFSFFIAPIMPLMDNAILDLLGPRRESYGKLRVWGAVGWGCAVLVMGWLVGRGGLRWPFYGYFTFMLLVLLVTFGLPIRATSRTVVAWRDFQSMLKNPQWLSFLFAAMLGGIGMSLVNIYLLLYLQYLGGANALMGPALAAATLSELLVFPLSGWLLRRLGTRSLLVAALLALVVRLLAYSWLRDPLPALFVQLLHGPSFSLMWVAGVSYARQTAPPGLGATAQGLFSGTMLGLGAAIGAFTGGQLYDLTGPLLMFRWVGFGLLAGLCVYLLASTFSFSERFTTKVKKTAGARKIILK